ncbi:hypothetical protein PVAP13_6KG402701 [Panicum virgatum]|uniref:Uncharacterized protein n=1 Tax=Panicum virgatum TaxID=38727 RepID=A0A8T0RHQ2_PANVG|nr:hypothetical protein PVAP13_6KG402701 [Panicum virgatum]
MNHVISIERSEALSPHRLPVNLRIGSSLIPLPPSSFSLPLCIARVPALAAALNRRLVAGGRRGAAPAASLSLASLLEDLGRPPQTLPSFVFLPLFHRHPCCLLPRRRPPSKFDISGSAAKEAIPDRVAGRGQGSREVNLHDTEIRTGTASSARLIEMAV